MIRKPFLINRALKTYIVASLLSSSIGQVNSIVDGMLMGHFISPNALSAISLTIPVITIASVVYILFAAGAALLAGKAIGERNRERIDGIFSVSIISLAIASTILSIMAWIFADKLAGVVCNNETILPYVVDYLQWTMGLSFITMLSQALSQFTDVDGKPLIVTRTILLATVLNIAFDIILVPVCGLGIKGSAIATTISMLGSGLYLLKYICSKECSYHFKLAIPGFFNILLGNLKNGLPMTIGLFLTAGFFMFMNTIIMDSLGATGMFTGSIACSLLSICSLLSAAASQSFVAVGSMLYGQKDYHGMRMLYNRCLGLTLLSSVVFTIVGQVCPDLIAIAYGADNPELIAETAESIRVFSLMLIPFQLITLLPPIHQVLGYIKLVSAFTIVYYLIFIPTIYVFAHSDSPELLWWAFPVTNVAAMVVCAICLFFIHCRIKGVGMVSLIPLVPPCPDMLDISVPCNIQSRDAALEEIRKFVNGLNLQSEVLASKVRIAIEETMNNIVQFSGMKPSQCFDIRITMLDNKISVMLKDNGMAFDPLNFGREKQSIGMTLIQALCPKLEYKYMYGQNMSFMTWNTDESKNEYRSEIPNIGDANIPRIFRECIQ